eukprot:Ihof_evm4s149 gene=Ihof_evmTU4s149
MDVIGAVVGQIGGIFDGRVVGGREGQVHRTMTDIRLLVKGLNILLIVVVVVVVVMSTSAVLLDWAYWYRGVELSFPEGSDPSPSAATRQVVVQLKRGDGLQVSILKAVISSVIGFLVMQLLRGLASHQTLNNLEGPPLVNQLVDRTASSYQAVKAFVANRKAVWCVVTAVGLSVTAVLVRMWSSQWLAYTLAVMAGMCYWTGFTLLHQARTITENVKACGIKGEGITLANQQVHIVIAGMEAAGKTSLLKAIMGQSRYDQSEAGKRLAVGMFAVKEVQEVTIENTLVLHDMPGQTLIKREGGAKYDIGIFVVVRSADRVQHTLYNELKAVANKVFLVRNQSDDLRNMRPPMRDQWLMTLDLPAATPIYCTCTFGYDPMARDDVPMDLEGIDKLKADILQFLEEGGRSILIARQLSESSKAGMGVITKALTKAMIGQDVICVRQQALEELHYLYTGEMKVTIYPPAVHPAASLWIKVISLLPYINNISSTISTTTTLCVQLIGVQRALEQQKTREMDPEHARAYAAQCVMRTDGRILTDICHH